MIYRNIFFYLCWQISELANGVYFIEEKLRVSDFLNNWYALKRLELIVRSIRKNKHIY